MGDYTELASLADAIHGPGSTMQMLARWRAFENACHPALIKELIADVDRLKAENAGLRTGYEAYEQVNAELKAEVELLESSRAKLAGELSRLRAKHKDWSVIAALGQGEKS